MYAMYSVKAVAELTGLTPETLRAWERRHGIVAPGRDASGRRAYDRADVERLGRLKRLTDRGHAIRHLAQLDDARLAEMDRAPPARPPTVPAVASGELDGLRLRLSAAAHEYRADDFDRTLGIALATVPTARLLKEVLAPLLREVGEAWEHGTLDIAQERLVTSALKTRMLALVNQRERRGDARLLLATLSGERHELGLLLVALLALSLGTPFHYLGADLPAVEIARLAERLEVDVVALSVVVPDPRAGASLRELRALLGPSVQLWLGGASAADAAGALGKAVDDGRPVATLLETDDAAAGGVRVLADLALAEQALRDLRDGALPAPMGT